MKIKIPIVIAASLFQSLNPQLPTCFAQGSLTPTGPPGQTMKSLDQIEPRTPIATNTTPGDGSDLFIISQPGSYYLTANLVGVSGKSGIEIITNNVTLDLRGFTMLGVPGSINGVSIGNGYTNIVVRDGTISGWSEGIYDNYSYSATRIFERLTLSADGDGIVSSGTNDIVRHCLSQNNTYTGIQVGGGSLVTGCVVNGNGTHGIALYGSGSQILGNTCAGNDTQNSSFYGGIYVLGANNRVENNHVSGTGTAGYGIYVYNTGGVINNVIVKNTVAGGGANNFKIAPGNDVGPIGTATNSVSPWANISH